MKTIRIVFEITFRFLFLFLTACTPQERPTSVDTPTVSLLSPTQAPVSSPIPSSTPKELPTFTLTPTPTEPIIPCMAYFSPIAFLNDDDHLLGVYSMDGQSISQIQILDVKTSETKTIFEYERAPIDNPVLSSDQQWVAVPMTDYSVQLIGISDGMVKTTFIGHINAVSAMVFSPMGDKLYTGSMDETVNVWDLDGNLLHTFPSEGADGFPSEVAGMGISSDGTQLVTIPLEGRIKVWETANFTKLGEYEGPIFGAYNGASASFSPDGEYLAVGLAAGPGAVSLWKVADGALLWRGGFFGFAFSPDGQYFAHTEVGEGNEFTEQIVLSSANGQSVVQSFEKVEQPIGKMFFSSDSRQLVVIPGFSKTEIWSVETGQLLFSYQASCSE